MISKLKEFGGGKIIIETNTDSRGSHLYNLRLAEKRANTIREILSENLGEDMLHLVSVEVDPKAYGTGMDTGSSK